MIGTGIWCIEAHASTETTPISGVDSFYIPPFSPQQAVCIFIRFDCMARVKPALPVLMNALHACFSISNGYMIARPLLKTCQDFGI